MVIDFFRLFAESLFLSAGAGTATVAIILFIFGPKVETPNAGQIVGRIYAILKFVQVVLLAIVSFYLTVILLDIFYTNVIHENTATYILKCIFITGTVVSGFLMTRKIASPKNGVVFTGGGWYSYSIIHIATIGGMFSNSASNVWLYVSYGILVYIVICIVIYILIRLRDKIQNRLISRKTIHSDEG